MRTDLDPAFLVRRPPTQVSAAASTAVADVLDGAERVGHVVAAFRTAVHMATGEPNVPLVCLATADAVRLPFNLVVGMLPAAAVGDRAVIGAGRIAVGGVEVRPARWWKPARPRLRDLGHARRRAASLPLDPAEPVGAVLASAASLTELAPALLGLGPGLTPAGDDVLAGALVALRACGDPAGDTLAAAVATLDPPTRTTAVSAALLIHAFRGECVPELASLLAALDGRADLSRALNALLAVGGTTGRALAVGVRLALLGDAT